MLQSTVMTWHFCVRKTLRQKTCAYKFTFLLSGVVQSPGEVHRNVTLSKFVETWQVLGKGKILLLRGKKKKKILLPNALYSHIFIHRQTVHSESKVLHSYSISSLPNNWFSSADCIRTNTQWSIALKQLAEPVVINALRYSDYNGYCLRVRKRGRVVLTSTTARVLPR